MLKCLGGCHRCECPPKSYLDTDTQFRSKITARVKKTVMAAAAGIPGAGRPVVQFCHNGRQHTKGPAGRDYRREHSRLGFHLFFSTFWMISTFCLFQMHMRDSLHQTAMELSFTSCEQYCVCFTVIVCNNML